LLAACPSRRHAPIATWGTAIRQGYLDQLSTLVEDLTGRPARSLGSVLDAHRDQLLPAA